MLDRTLAIAPMMAWTTRHQRFFLRQITRRTLLYTEMVTAGALIHGNTSSLLFHHPGEHPLALQVGGCDPQELAWCAMMAQAHGFAELNLNVGCPSDRVRNGRFGACLMAEPERVAACVAAMCDACNVPVTVKTRIGIDDMDSEQALDRFVGSVADAGCGTFIIHARKAWLEGLSPKQNREIPPLDYARVRRLKQKHPDLEIIINGGVKGLDTAQQHLKNVDGVMLGRAAYKAPYLLADADRRFFACQQHPPSRDEVVQRLLPYTASEVACGTPLKHITRHVLGLYQGQPGARRWRRYLSEHSHRSGAGVEVIREAFNRVRDARKSASRRQAA